MTVDPARLPFDEAIRFFRQKLDMPTQAHTDLREAMHDRAFVVAGVTRQDVLTDLRAAVDKAIAQGTTLERFRQDFDAAVMGKWEPRQDRGWRTRVIYETNIRTAYAAGRWAQLQEMRSTHPYWEYRHGDSRRPRPEHLAWNGLVLQADDPWWQAHYPPCGWGCRCSVVARSADQLDRQGKTVGTAPPVKLVTHPWGEGTIQAPKGVDPGWGYAPGGSGAQGLLRALAGGHPPLAAQAWAEIGQAAVREETPAFRAWAEKVANSQRGANEARVVGFLRPDILAGITARGLTPPSAAIEILDKDISHMVRDAKVKAGKGVPLDSILGLPGTLENPKAVLFDKNKRNLLYVFDVSSDPRKGKFVVQVGMPTTVQTHPGRVHRPMNRVKTAGLVAITTLRDPHSYEPLAGAL